MMVCQKNAVCSCIHNGSEVDISCQHGQHHDKGLATGGAVIAKGSGLQVAPQNINIFSYKLSCDNEWGMHIFF